jgi:hypothetical protein
MRAKRLSVRGDAYYVKMHYHTQSQETTPVMFMEGNYEVQMWGDA